MEAMGTFWEAARPKGRSFRRRRANGGMGARRGPGRPVKSDEVEVNPSASFVPRREKEETNTVMEDNIVRLRFFYMGLYGSSLWAVHLGPFQPGVESAHNVCGC